MKNFRVHHIMCTNLYQGYGYSGAFCENMTEMVTWLKSNPDEKLLLVTDPDEICKKCPKSGQFQGANRIYPAGKAASGSGQFIQHGGHRGAGRQHRNRRIAAAASGVHQPGKAGVLHHPLRPPPQQRLAAAGKG